MIKPGKLNILIDGQFGSTGKGLAASYIADWEHIDISVTNASTNAGHTFYIGNEKYITKHLPTTGILSKRSTIYLCAGAIINPKILLEEIKTFNIDKNRITIHPRAAVIEDIDIYNEINGPVKKIASTMSGVGSALIRKINRESKLAGGNKLLHKMIGEIDLQFYLSQGCNVLMEVPQGFDLSINSGLSYPHCTSREITVSAALSDAQVHPSYLGNVIVVIRTFPIRVGNIIENNETIGFSGPFYEDSKEISWKDIGVNEEFTTNTKRIRRVATFSFQQYKKMIKMLKPDFVILNFCNYLNKKDLKTLIDKINLINDITHISFGPKPTEVYIYNY
jgi:adenylosuccinate synthase